MLPVQKGDDGFDFIFRKIELGHKCSRFHRFRVFQPVLLPRLVVAFFNCREIRVKCPARLTGDFMARKALISPDQRFTGGGSEAVALEYRGLVHRLGKLFEIRHHGFTLAWRPRELRHQRTGLHCGGVVEPFEHPLLAPAQRNLIEIWPDCAAFLAYRMAGLACILFNQHLTPADRVVVRSGDSCLQEP